VFRLLQDRVTRRYTLVTASVWGVTAGWWYFRAWDDIWRNLGMSTQQHKELAIRFEAYFLEAPELLVLTMLALAAIPLVFTRLSAERPRVVLLGATLVSGIAALLFYFDPQGRYMLPLHAVAMVLLGAGGAVFLRRASARTHRLVSLVAILGLVTLSLAANTLSSSQTEQDLISPRGLMMADQKDLTGYARAHQMLRGRTHIYALICRDDEASAWTVDEQLAVLKAGDPRPIMTPVGLSMTIGGRGPVYVLEARLPPSLHRNPKDVEVMSEPGLLPWFLEQERTLLATFKDDSPVEYRIHLIQNPRLEDLPVAERSH
jgi:hypothetical protein